MIPRQITSKTKLNNSLIVFTEPGEDMSDKETL